MLNDLLDLAKLESGKMLMDYKPGELKEVAESCVLEQHARLEENKIEIIYFSDNVTGAGTFDALRIGQVITNLLSNAIKFTPQGESIELSISETLIKSEDHIPAFLFSVKDSGKGILESELKLIFNKFEQGSESTLGTTKGTGLGLPICKEIIELHHGSIWADNHSGGGAIFSFIIPKQAIEIPEQS